MHSKEKISDLRNKIDSFDDQMLDLLVKRFAVSKEIGEIKASGGINVGDLNREQEIIDRLADKLEGKLARFQRTSQRALWPVYRRRQRKVVRSIKTD